ncbi:hypothetical protein [Streptomyces mirabilis]|uniref:hypothetical protein n=1 Tax=Streptomyces mirabilis TaxID=68239 RepID=UPI0031B9FC26
MDWFEGVGGSTQGADAVPGVKVTGAANHWKQAIASHERNFPGVAHYIGDIRKAPVWAWPITDIHWGSPECFPAGTMILTRRGMVPIEDVAVGDLRRRGDVGDLRHLDVPLVQAVVRIGTAVQPHSFVRLHGGWR